MPETRMNTGLPVTFQKVVGKKSALNYVFFQFANWQTYKTPLKPVNMRVFSVSQKCN